MYIASLLAALSLALIQTAFAANADAWRSRSIYQVITDRFARPDGSVTSPCDSGSGLYCGGTWQGIINKLDYIQGMGFDAIWISPITKNLEGKTAYGEAYHGYWQQDITQLNQHFGSPNDLKALAANLHGRGMYLMVDIVVNHNGYNGAVNTIDFSKFVPFNSSSNYHFPYCQPDYNNLGNLTQIQDCWMGDNNVPLPDLRTEDSYVASTYQRWINGLVRDYNIDGLRLDTVLQVNTGFWNGFNRAIAGMYMVGEIWQSAADFVCNYQNYIPAPLNYPVYGPLVSAFKSTSGSMSDLSKAIKAVKSSCKDATVLGSFSENHDNPRFAFLNGDFAAASNLISFTMLADGIPIIYQGQEQHYSATGSTNGNDPYNREALWFSQYNTNAQLYQLIKTLNAIRKNAIRDDSSYLTSNNGPIYTDTTTITMKKGKMFTVLTNKGINGANYTQAYSAGYPSGTKVTELLTCSQLTADSSGKITVPMGAGQPRIYYPSANLGVLCGGTAPAPNRGQKNVVVRRSLAPSRHFQR